MKYPILLLLPFTASADLVVTEAMASSNHLDTSINGDWWELTNNGISAVNLNGYSWDDASNLSGEQTFPSYLIQPGESVIMLDEGSVSAIAPFRTAWSLASTVKIFVESDFGGFPGFSGGSGDTIYLYQPSGSVIDSFSFGPSTAGISFSNFENGNSIPGGVSQTGIFSAVASTENPRDIGSPGIAPALPPPVSPSFEGPFALQWPVGQNINQMAIKPSAVDPNPEDIITLSVITKPDWLTVTFPGNGLVDLSGVPPVSAAGTEVLRLSAGDDSGLTPLVEVSYTLHLLKTSSPIILNEFNAVSEDFYLDGAEEGEAGAPSDPNLGQILGNGGEWLEFVVTGDGTDSIDLRSHTIEMIGNGNTHVLRLTDHLALSEIPTGTILTLSRNYETNLSQSSNLASTGILWSNIWFYDPVLIDLENSQFSDDPVLSDLDTRVRVFDASSTIIYGPSGESVAALDTDSNGSPDQLVSVNNTEVFKLEQNPTATVNPLFGVYRDGSSSTYGEPNLWSGGTATQSFASFLKSNSPPQLNVLPVNYSIRGSYSSEIQATDPQAQDVSFTPTGVPDFLTFSDGGNGSATLVNNRPITATDVGEYEITILADDGQASFNKAYHAFQLTVYDPAPKVILNEYNAISDLNYLNGGDENFDRDGLSTTQDTYFGRAQGNGFNWFELAVIGDGGPSIVDMRGWTIVIGEGEDGGRLIPEGTITLTQNDFWAAVPAGTILTFIENNTANGGLDTSLDRVDQFSTEGWGWSNIHLGDSSLVSVTGEIDIDSTSTQFTISDPQKLIFGPVGEGLLDGVNVSNEEVFNLEADPRPTTSMFDNGDLVQGAGYDDASIDSTFGSRNRYLPLGGGQTKVLQDFSPFIPPVSTYLTWAQEFGEVATDDPANDFDSDGWTNLEEYLFGGIPNNPLVKPSSSLNPLTGMITHSVRSDDAAYRFTAQRSSDLQNWTSADLTVNQRNSDLGPSFRSFQISYTGNAPKQFFRVKAE